jgi:hypothetical protein
VVGRLAQLIREAIFTSLGHVRCGPAFIDSPSHTTTQSDIS